MGARVDVRPHVREAVRDVQDPEQRDEDWELGKHREASAERVDAVLPVQLHLLFLHLLAGGRVLLALVLALELPDLGLNDLHGLHRADLHGDQLDQNRQQDDVDPVVRDVPIQEGQCGPDRIEQDFEGGREGIGGDHAPGPPAMRTSPGCRRCMRPSYTSGRAGG